MFYVQSECMCAKRLYVVMPARRGWTLFMGWVEPNPFLRLFPVSEWSAPCLQGGTTGDELECILPSLYRNVARQLNISVSMENMVSDAFIGVATEIFSTGITWGKVVSMYAVAGALAVDCVRQGHATTVHIIVDSLGQFVRKYLAHWLKRRGGWEDMTKCVVKKDLSSEHHWLSSALESLRYFLTMMYVYIMKDQ
ncbi:bcl-2-related ovarian killer protein homolog B-like isoform X2 [Nerophis lumbriciformis]|uniref:bcl-2-related ovarian killer protein homolog B-like isoform X2 n=1 Tax=Nerophis lumbriciformis TaxID=546530 RepID=UPI002ADFA948|nr:bcl-2-related ovarian killer protein homolog B-like isoform X2 [Nerophis lumbriciformis]